MNFLAPAAAAFFALAIPIIILYMLRLRRREVVVSSIFLWQMLLEDREANAPWQKLRRNLLLILQLLILAMLVLALMRPALPAAGGAARGAAVIIDASASMNAADLSGGETRFSAALDEARALIASLPPDRAMTLILAGPTPRVLIPATGDHAALRAALDDPSASLTGADWVSAFTLAAASLAGDPEGEIIVISDGGLPSDLPVMPVPVRFIPIGVSGDNLAITALAIRAIEGVPQLFVSIENYGQQPRDARLEVRIDGVIREAERISVAAGGIISRVVDDLPAESSQIEASLLSVDDEPLDRLALDDDAFAVYEPVASGQILLISEGNFFLETLLSVLPGMTVTRAAPGTLPGDDADLIVLDGWLPDPLPEADLLIIDPPGSSEAFSVAGSFRPADISQVADPILAFVDFSSVAFREAVSIEDAPWARPLVQSGGRPLLLAGERDGQKIAILSFDLRDSDLPLKIDFPILIANLMDWFAPASIIDTRGDIRPGDPVSIRLSPAITQLRVTAPGGDITRLPSAGEGALAFTETAEVGIYRVELLDGLEVDDSTAFAVNSFIPGESAIAPRESIIIGEAAVSPAEADDDEGWIELWPLFAGLALALLALEWWVYHRR